MIDNHVDITPNCIPRVCYHQFSELYPCKQNLRVHVKKRNYHDVFEEQFVIYLIIRALDYVRYSQFCHYIL